VAAVVGRYGRVDCLVNAAGLTARGTLLDTTPELFDATSRSTCAARSS
jgi:NAD(P)-dependent dehydrogenase (short-subunit alcohol dehydrogenase family)